MSEKKYKLVETNNNEAPFKTDWRSIMISNIVAFLGSVTMSSITPTVWPYMKKVDVTTTETLYGFIRGLYALGNVIFSMISGYLSNKISDTKPAMIIGKAVTVMAAIAYLAIEVFPTSYVGLFILFEILLGSALGIGSVFRTHIAMASTESDRQRAFGITQLAQSTGLIVGPLLQVAFSKIKYPGLLLIAGAHFNLYTAPLVLLALTSIFGIFLLFACFDGKMRIEKAHPAPVYTEDVALGTVEEDVFLEEKTPSEKDASNAPKYDLIAVIVLIFAKVASDLVFLNLVTVMPPYAMTMFQWSSEDAIVFQSAIGALVGFLAITFSLIYVIYKVGSRIQERSTLVFTLGLFLMFHVVTYPWDFWPNRIEYQHVKGTVAPLNRSMALDPALRAIVVESQKPGSKIQIVGCNPAFEWCETTAKINIFVFYGAAVLAIGIGLPLIHINLDILYSKVLGPIKQGTLQGVFVATGQVLNIIGPLVFSHLYTLYGPKILWGFEIAVVGTALAVFIFFYKRMIPWSERPDVKDHLKPGLIAVVKP